MRGKSTGKIRRSPGSGPSRQEAFTRLDQTQLYLLQREKLASLGQMAAGVAHEINNPVGYVYSNLTTLAEYVQVFKELVAECDRLAELLKDEPALRPELRESLARINRIRERENLGFILSDIDSLLSDSLGGAERVRDIVLNLRNFARTDESELKDWDINQGIEDTLKIVWNELKYKAKVIKKLSPLPLVRCYPGQLNQVFLNLLLNAVQAIRERGEITLETHTENDQIVVRVSDTGEGIPAERIERIFDPFFSTKPKGKGTGLGLSISFTIVEKHNGKIEVESEPGRGSTFTVRLPVEGIANE